MTLLKRILKDRVLDNGLLPLRVLILESATGRFSFLICLPLWCSDGVPPLCFFNMKNDEGLKSFCLHELSGGLYEEQIQAESLNCENDALTNFVTLGPSEFVFS